MNCAKCGNTLRDGDVFCNRCGSRAEVLAADVTSTPNEVTATTSETEVARPNVDVRATGGGLGENAVSREAHKGKNLKRRLLVLGSALLIALTVVVGVLVGERGMAHTNAQGSSTPTASLAPTSHQSNLVSVNLPLLVCRTTNGVSSAKPANLPSTVDVMLPSGFSGRLDVYSDNQGIMELPTPKGWGCIASIGADGSGTLEIAPPNQPKVYTGALAASSTVQEISASETSACVGCTLGQACPLFETAAVAYQADFGQSCPTAAPREEGMTSVGSNVVEFTDPPGISGDGSPSGGVNSAIGAMTYNPNTNDGSWAETCVLPASQHAICFAIVSNFVASYGSK
ncbi:hypothetical protein [Acidithrix ferrooxidans]|uniref:Zinc-ribbon domain-containing protein n=1 Tax=Acidithrix ferrooxidans TaxID=1280514 RepID=A0A0D8HI67_9ACTN|nr:hypothetical protein [Acidithrix ferrooxidans]KJF17452.1 hypothetical protein AXFE_16880 [Acidithrix ferrooxidans]